MLVKPITYEYSMPVVLLAFSPILLSLKTSLCITLLVVENKTRMEIYTIDNSWTMIISFDCWLLHIPRAIIIQHPPRFVGISFLVQFILNSPQLANRVKTNRKNNGSYTIYCWIKILVYCSIFNIYIQHHLLEWTTLNFLSIISPLQVFLHPGR